ncbi:MAG: fumarylacetoacetate hydrolase family protein, partial [Polyangia bacterium]
MESEQANRPQWTGRGFEIWFFVVLVPGRERALWVRLTRFCDGGASDARIWAVLSEGQGVTAQREILPLEQMTTEAPDGSFHLRVGESELRRGFSRGRCGRIAWELCFEPNSAAVARVPKLPGFVPLGTRATHPHAEAPVRGWVELDGRRLALDGGLLTQMHLWGHKRVEWLRWAWVPRFDRDGQLELTAVAPEAGGPGLCALWARVGDQVFDGSGLLKAARARVSSVRPGVLHHVGAYGAHRLVVRTWAVAESFAGWDYRQVGGGDLHVAQSNLARCELELFRKVGLGWQPERRLRSTCAALEFHGPEEPPELGYVAWDAREVRARERRVTPSEPTPRPPSEPGRWIDTPAPDKIVALGLTYREHVAETGSAPDAVVFPIEPSAWIGAGPTPSALPSPSSARLRASIARLDPGLVPRLAGFGFMPALLDYEAEVGLLLLDGLRGPHELERIASGGRVGWVVANDVTARSIQILGEGQPDRLAYWTASKSLPGCKPTSARAWLPERFELDRWPALRLQTRVNGALRQDAALEL